jgi:hypothetical protein
MQLENSLVGRDINPLVGNLRMGERWITQEHTKPILEFMVLCQCNCHKAIAALFEPRMVALMNDTALFAGYGYCRPRMAKRRWRCKTGVLCRIDGEMSAVLPKDA